MNEFLNIFFVVHEIGKFTLLFLEFKLYFNFIIILVHFYANYIDLGPWVTQRLNWFVGDLLIAPPTLMI